MKNIPNTLTAIRVIISVILLFVESLSPLFFCLYIVCGVTDILDGHIARKTKSISTAGAIFDSIADFIFIMIMLFIMIPIIDISYWIQIWLIGISIVKATTLLTGFIKYRSFAFLHTYMNKITGALLFAFPVLYYGFGITITAALLCSIASVAAVEEMIINLTANKLSLDIKSIFIK